MDGCTCAYTQNKHGHRDWKPGISLCVVPSTAGRCFCCWNTGGHPRQFGGVLTLDSSSHLFNPLFSSVLVIETFVSTHALIYFNDDVQVFSDKMQQGSMSLHAKSLVSLQCFCVCVFAHWTMWMWMSLLTVCEFCFLFRVNSKSYLVSCCYEAPSMTSESISHVWESSVMANKLPPSSKSESG